MIRHLCAAFLLLFTFALKAQCPQIYDYLGALSYTPQFINCNGNAYVVNFQSNVSFGSYTVSWGDGTADHTATSYTAMSIVSHTYAAATNSYILSFTTGTCVITGTVVNEQPALASIVVPSGVGSTLCAPKTLTFTNATTFTSATTSYTWSFGDGTAPEVHTYTNSGQNVLHLYQKGTVNCVTSVTLMARNYCNFTPSSNSFGPLQVYDIDDAGITPDRFVRCWPDNQFTFSNSTQRNCLPEGNTSQRYELWNFGNYWGTGDSLIGWDPWPPSMPRVVSYSATGSYSVLLVDSNVCGIDAQVIYVNIVNPPVAGIVVPTGTICQNTSVTFTNTSAPGYQYRWNFGDGGGFVTLPAGPRSYTYATPGTYTVKLVALIPGAGGACADTSQGVVSIMPSPTPSFVVSPSVACGSLAATFNNLSTGAVAWNWDFGNGNTSTAQNPASQNYTAPATYVATLAATSASGCVFSATASLLVRNIPHPVFPQANACEDIAMSFTNNSTAAGVDPISGYTWSFGDGSAVSTATNPIHTYTLSGTYTVQLKASTGFCEDSSFQAVTIFVKPTASFVATPTAGCPPFTANFANQSLNANSFLWRFGAAPSATANTTGASYTYTNNTQNFVSYTVTLLSVSPAGCADSTTTEVVVRPKPVSSFTSNLITGCSPMATTFSSTSQGASTYSWSFGDNTSSAAANPVHVYSNTTLFTQTVTAILYVTNSVSCTDTASQLITIYPEALNTFTMIPQSGCSPLLVNFPSVPGVATYSWNHGDGTGTYTTLTQHNHTFLNSTLADKVFTVTLLATTSNSCSGSASGTVLVYHNPIANFTFTPPGGCTPLSVNFQNTSSGSIGSTKWQFGNGQTSNNAAAVTVFTNGPGEGEKNYSAKLVVSTINGCLDSVSRNIVMYSQPLARFTPDTPACAPKSIRFTNTSTGAVSFFWTFGDGSASSADTVQHLYTNNSGITQTYQAKLRATSSNMCSDSVTVPIRIYPKPEFIIAATPDHGCSPLTVFFPKIAGAEQYEWKYDNSISFGSAGNIYNTFENKGNTTRVFTVQLVARNIHTCADTSTKLITVYPLPTAKFSARPLSVFIPNEPVNFTNESSNLAVTFMWDFGDDETSTVSNPVHLYKKAGEYKVTLVATSIQGCLDTFQLGEYVTALEETSVQMPNAFTPNTAGSPGTLFDPNDTSNDIFHPNVKGADQYRFSVYSRWGELLFETRDPAHGWDGYYKGNLCTQDVYIWKISATFIDGKSINQTGDVLLLR
jgi:gliding motility-associated-like protein